MSPEYSLSVVATGEDDAIVETTATVEANTPDEAKTRFAEQVEHVEYWEFEISHVEEN